MSDSEALEAFKSSGLHSQDTTPRALRYKRITSARIMLAKKGVREKDPVFITATDIDTDNSDLEDAQEKNSNRPLPMVCDVLGETAVYCLADRTHRLSTPEEIERFNRDQLARRKDMEEREASNPNNKTVRQNITITADAAVKAGLLPGLVGEPARPRRNVEAGEKG